MNENTNEVTEKSNSDQQPQPQANADALNLNDLSALRSIIDLASERGAFRPNEMMFVGQAYERLSNFLLLVERAKAQNPNQGV